MIIFQIKDKTFIRYIVRMLKAGVLENGELAVNDDVVIYTYKRHAATVLELLKQRMERFSLTLNDEKTKVVSFSKEDANKGVKQGTFSFLGFTFYLVRSRKGVMLVKIKTNKKTFASKIKDITEWCKSNRNRYRLKLLWKTFIAKIRGHIQYYGVSHNFYGVAKFIFMARRIFFTDLFLIFSQRN